MDGFRALPNGGHDSLPLFSGPMFAPPPGEAEGLTLDDMFADDLFAMDGDSDADQSGAAQSGRTPSGDFDSPAQPTAAPGHAASEGPAGAAAPTPAAAPRRSRRARGTASPAPAAAEAAAPAGRKATAKSSKGAALQGSARPTDQHGNEDDDDDDDDDDDGDDDDDDDESGDGDGAGKRPRPAADSSAPAPKRPRRRAATQEERLQRSRERNRIHARKSRLRKKFFVDSLKASLDALEEENKALKAFVKDRTGMTYEELVKTPITHPLLTPAAASTAAPSTAPPASTITTAAPAAAATTSASGPAAGTVAAPLPAPPTAPPATAPAAAPARSLVGGVSDGGTRHLERQDFALMSVLQSAQQNFVVSDPNMEDNPIVFASQGFYDLTGYSPAEVISRNCRFLQGPLTDPSSVAKIRDGIRNGRDVSVCLVNYRRDGTPFWNQFFVAPLRDVHGRVVNFVGVQCAVTEEQATAIHAAEAGQAGVPSRARQLPTANAALAAARHSAHAAAAAPPAARVLPALLPGEDAFPIATSTQA